MFNAIRYRRGEIPVALPPLVPSPTEPTRQRESPDLNDVGDSVGTCHRQNRHVGDLTDGVGSVGIVGNPANAVFYFFFSPFIFFSAGSRGVPRPGACGHSVGAAHRRPMAGGPSPRGFRRPCPSDLREEGALTHGQCASFTPGSLC